MRCMNWELTVEPQSEALQTLFPLQVHKRLLWQHKYFWYKDMIPFWQRSIAFFLLWWVMLLLCCLFHKNLGFRWLKLGFFCFNTIVCIILELSNQPIRSLLNLTAFCDGCLIRVLTFNGSGNGVSRLASWTRGGQLSMSRVANIALQMEASLLDSWPTGLDEWLGSELDFLVLPGILVAGSR